MPTDVENSRGRVRLDIDREAAPAAIRASNKVSEGTGLVQVAGRPDVRRRIERVIPDGRTRAAAAAIYRLFVYTGRYTRGRLNDLVTRSDINSVKSHG